MCVFVWKLGALDYDCARGRGLAPSVLRVSILAGGGGVDEQAVAGAAVSAPSSSEAVLEIRAEQSLC